MSIDYDPGLDNGIFGVAAYRVVLNADNDLFVIGLRDSLNFISTPKTYDIAYNKLAGVVFWDRNFCNRRSDDSTNFSNGVLQVTKHDRTQKIIAGTFEVTLFNPQCGDTIRITKGRFDMKF